MNGKKVYDINDKQKILYVITNVNEDKAVIVGVYYRIIKEVIIKDLIEASDEDLKKEQSEYKKRIAILEQTKLRGKKYLLGRILHIDADQEYLNKCIELYRTIGVFAYGALVEENKVSKVISKYIEKLCPDIVVITGHDLYNNNGLKELNNYTNTKYFIDAVKEARKIRSRSDMIIIAGACQSNFEALIANGADFASSPKRLNIHAFDPAIIAIKAATTSFDKKININDIERFIEHGKDAFNGVECYGKMRLVL